MVRKKDEVLDLYAELAHLCDIRRAQGKRHRIEDVVMIVILAIMSGYHGYHAIWDFVKKNSQGLICLLNPSKGRLPSLSTIRRVITNIDFDELNQVFEKWSRHHIKIREKEWISLDGKAIKGTMPEEMHKFVNLVSLFCVEKKLVYSMGNVNEKSNEIPKVQELIDNFPVTGVVYRMDALHCQKKTVRSILKKGSFYVLEVKGNQKTLHRKVKFIAEYLPAVSFHRTSEKNRGRREIRTVTTHKEHLDLKHYGWEDLKLIIKVHRKVKLNTGKISEETAYFITNLNEKASLFNKGIREHWAIENSLHYMKDVVFREDRLKIRSGNAPQNMSLLRTWAMNIFRRKGHHNITSTIRLFSDNIKASVALLA